MTWLFFFILNDSFNFHYNIMIDIKYVNHKLVLYLVDKETYLKLNNS